MSVAPEQRMAPGLNGVLLPQHAKLIQASAITPAVAAARGYRSVQTKVDLRRLGFSDRQCIVPTLLVPVLGVTGEVVLYQHRPDQPRIADGKPIKYETPRGSRMALDVPPLAGSWVGDPARPLVITEGVRKADSAVSAGLCGIALLGVWNWRGSNAQGGTTALADWEQIALKRRKVYLAFDSDVMEKPEVYQALARLKAFLEQRGAQVRLIYLPSGDGGAKVGLDDYLAMGHSVDTLLALATSELRRPPPAEDGDTGLYVAHQGCLCWRKRERDGEVLVPLCNFDARISAEVLRDDGAEVEHLFEIAGTHETGRPFAPIQVSATQYGAMNWPVAQWGVSAVVSAGLGAKDRLREAIQRRSGDVPRRVVYAHLGWRQLDGAWAYLHTGGAISADGLVPGVEVALPDELARYHLPAPPPGDDLVAAIRASLRLLELAPDHQTVPLHAAIWRAVQGGTDLSLHLTGPTGEGKTELVALIQQHFGPQMDARHLPASWASTGNSLEGLAFAAKDTVLTVDDFAPTGTTYDVQRLHREADRLLRAQGNRAGRQRMRSDATLRPTKLPRGLILSTGEDVPRGQSLRARLFVLEVSPGDVDWAQLTQCQQDAADGLYAQALSGFIRWLAPCYDEMRRGLRAEGAALRQQATQSLMHRRTPGIIADLAVGWRAFLRYAQGVEALTPHEADALWQRGWAALGQAAAVQAQHQAASEPASRFVELLGAALASGQAHVAAADGNAPERPDDEEMPKQWGWRLRIIGTGDNEREEWQAQGRRVGWLDGDDLYIEPDAAFSVVQRLGRDVGDALTVQSRTLHKRLRERGCLLSTGGARGATVRKTVEGARRLVLHLQVSLLIGRTAQTAHTNPPLGSSQGTPPRNGQFSWAVSEATDAETAQETAQQRASAPGDQVDSTHMGSLGSKSRMEGEVPAQSTPCTACPRRAIGHWRDGTPYCEEHRPGRREAR